MAETVVIRATGTDPDGATGTAEATITVTAPAPPDTTSPQITSFIIDDSTLDPGQHTNIAVTGTNYTRVIWAISSGVLTEDPDEPEVREKRRFTAPLNIVAGTEYIVSVTLANDFGSDIESGAITINNVAPAITSLTGIPQAPNFVTVGGSFTATAIANDANGDNLTYTWQAVNFTQSVGMAPNQRAFTAPTSIMGESDARKTVICTVRDVPPSPYTAESNSMQQDVIVAPGKPGSPTITDVVPSRNLIRFHWDAPANNGGSLITGYRVWIRVDDSPNFTRSAVLGPGITNHTYDNLALDTPHEVAVEAFNTFTIDGNNYGQTSDRDTENTRTRPVIVVPEPEDPNRDPILFPLTETVLFGIMSQIPDRQRDIVFQVSVHYFDEDGDTVEIIWEFGGDSFLPGVSFTFDPQPDPYVGIVDGYFTVPAGAVGRAYVDCIGIDGRSGNANSVTFNIGVMFET